MREFLIWVSDRRRSYDEAMEAWQSHCPRQTIWEDAIIEGLIQVQPEDLRHSPTVKLTELGKAFLKSQQNGHYE